MTRPLDDEQPDDLLLHPQPAPDLVLPASESVPSATSSGNDIAINPVHVDAINPIDLLLADKRSPQTRRAYEADLRQFFGEVPTPEDVQAFLSLTPNQVALRLTQYKAGLISQKLGEATINRRLAALRSLLKFAFRLGLSTTDGRGLVDSERSKSYRNTRGISVAKLRLLLALPAKIHGPGELITLRDTAMLRVLVENALRRAELHLMNVGDFYPSQAQITILGKGKGSQKEAITLSPKTIRAIEQYLIAAGHAGDPSAPLFRNLERRWTQADPDRAYGRLTPDGLYKIIRKYGVEIGVHLAPHKLRHSAITAALDATDGNVRKVQRLSRHADLRTLMIYDDNRTDMQGEMTNMLSELY